MTTGIPTMTPADLVLAVAMGPVKGRGDSVLELKSDGYYVMTNPHTGSTHSLSAVGNNTPAARLWEHWKGFQDNVVDALHEQERAAMDPYNPVVPSWVPSTLKWYAIHTGGGCTALQLDFEDGSYVMLTEHEDPSIPETAETYSMLGFFNADGDIISRTDMQAFGITGDAGVLCRIDVTAIYDMLRAVVPVYNQPKRDLVREATERSEAGN